MNTPFLLAFKAGSAQVALSVEEEGLRLLREAFEAARGEGRGVWQFAVEIGQLRAVGLSHTDLRRLLCRGYLEHAQECFGAGGSERIFRHLDTLALPEGSCFVLTSKGWAAASSGVGEGVGEVAVLAQEGVDAPRILPSAPHWDRESRQLWWQGCLVKEFRRPAANQERLLAVLEEEGWPARIDDPLPWTGDTDPKERLHDTIKSLNRNQQHRLLRFYGDGNGCGVRWLLLRK